MFAGGSTTEWAMDTWSSVCRAANDATIYSLWRHPDDAPHRVNWKTEEQTQGQNKHTNTHTHTCCCCLSLKWSGSNNPTKVPHHRHHHVHHNHVWMFMSKGLFFWVVKMKTYTHLRNGRFPAKPSGEPVSTVGLLSSRFEAVWPAGATVRR